MASAKRPFRMGRKVVSADEAERDCSFGACAISSPLGSAHVGLSKERIPKAQDCQGARGMRTKRCLSFDELSKQSQHNVASVLFVEEGSLGEIDVSGLSERVNNQDWRSLGIGPSELTLALTLPTGQSFRWKRTGSSEFTGVVGNYLYSLRQRKDDVYFLVHRSEAGLVDVEDAERCLRDYLNLGTSLKDMWAAFKAVDARFAALAPYLAGARLLRQHPLECVFQFICSSNNHIHRITNMVDYLASLGPQLATVKGIPYHAFPSLDQLATVTETQLRNAGFGYRAKYIIGTVQELQSKEQGGEEWLFSLRNRSLEDAVTALCSLPGIGPKVAACIALFSLDQHHAIPVDTHVWQIATKYLTPELAGARLSPKLHNTVSEAFVKRFGKYAGWAHTVLFIAELSSHQIFLPEHLRTEKVMKKKAKTRKKRKMKADIL